MLLESEGLVEIRPRAGVDCYGLVSEIERGERVEEIIRKPSRTPSRERGAQRTPDACERLVTACPGGHQRLEPARLHGDVVLDQREYLCVARGQRPVPRHGRPVGANPNDGRFRHVCPLERLQAPAEVGGGAGDDGNCRRPPNHAEAEYRPALRTGRDETRMGATRDPPRRPAWIRLPNEGGRRADPRERG